MQPKTYRHEKWGPPVRGVGWSIYLCPLKIIDLVSLFPKSDSQNYHVPRFPELILFPCFLKIFANISLFPEKMGMFLLPKTSGKTSTILRLFPLCCWQTLCDVHFHSVLFVFHVVLLTRHFVGFKYSNNLSQNPSRKHAYIILTPLNPTFI